MYGGLKSFALSLALHAGVVGGGMTMLSFMANSSEAVVIDLSITDTVAASGAETASTVEKTVQKPDRPEPSRPIPAVKPVKQAAAPEPVTEKQTQPEPSVAAATESLSDKAAAKDSATDSGLRQSAATGSGKAGTGGGGGQGSAGHGRNQGNSPTGDEQLQQIYTKEHFSYIKRIISERIRYPRAARVSRQQGTVLVMFTINRDGHISGLQVADSSGSSLLDQNAMEAVKDAAPFPRPPVVAQLKVPIVYSLNQH